MIGAHHQGNGDIGIKHNLFLHPSKLVTSNVSNRPLKVCSSEIWNSSLRMLVSSGNSILLKHDRYFNLVSLFRRNTQSRKMFVDLKNVF